MSQRKSYLTGLFGDGITASRSREIHEAEAERLGIKLVYRSIDFAAIQIDASQLQSMLQAAVKLGYDGINITHPYKQAVVPLLDELSEEAFRLQAVNTVAIQDGKTIGHNTDGYGFGQALQRKMPNVPKTRILQLGAGGAGSAVAYALLAGGVKTLWIFDINLERAHRLVDQISRHFPNQTVLVTESPEETLADMDGLVQTTPVGMTGHPGIPIGLDSLDSHHWVADIIYHPAKTELLAVAESRGCRTMNGTAMVALQAARAFHLFTGLQPIEDRMLDAVGA